MTYRVIQWATGFTGLYALKYILRNPALQLVGLRCFSADKAGRDAGELCGLTPVGVRATLSTEEILKIDADCVVYTPGMYDMANPAVPGSNTHEMFKTVLRLLESGKNVVTSICPLIDTGYYDGGDAVEEAINEACHRGGTSFLGTGLEPGFFGDVLPLLLASACGEVTRIAATEAMEYSEYPAFETLQQMGFARPPSELQAGALAGVLMTWGGGPHALARGLGVKLEDLKVNADVFLAPETFTVTAGVVPKGTIAGLMFSVTGIVGGEPRLVLRHVNRMRADMAPDWPRIPPNGGYRVEIEGSNPVVADFKLGLPGSEGSAFVDAMAMTAARCVNSIEAVVQASPGYKTFFDLPQQTGRHTMRAGR